MNVDLDKAYQVNFRVFFRIFPFVYFHFGTKSELQNIWQVIHGLTQPQLLSWRKNLWKRNNAECYENLKKYSKQPRVKKWKGNHKVQAMGGYISKEVKITD